MAVHNLVVVTKPDTSYETAMSICGLFAYLGVTNFYIVVPDFGSTIVTTMRDTQVVRYEQDDEMMTCVTGSPVSLLTPRIDIPCSTYIKVEL